MGTPLPGTNFYKYCFEDYSNNKSVIEEEILKIVRQFDDVYILVNYPFFAPSKDLRKSSAYSFYDSLAKNPEINYLVQSIDIINGGLNASVSWQNGHPNQRSVSKISDHFSNLMKQKTTIISADGF